MTEGRSFRTAAQLLRRGTPTADALALFFSDDFNSETKDSGLPHLIDLPLAIAGGMESPVSQRTAAEGCSAQGLGRPLPQCPCAVRPVSLLLFP